MLRKTIIIFLMVFMVLGLNIPFNANEASDLEIKYGKDSSITVQIIEDFSESEIDYNHVWRDGTVELEEGKIICEGIQISDSYIISVPKANENKELYQNAKYWGFEIRTACDGDIYYMFQTRINDQKVLLSPFIGDDIILVDKTGYAHEIIFSDGPQAYQRYAFIIPKDFEGYVLFPTNRLILFTDNATNWDDEETMWDSSVSLEGIGAHVSIGQNPYPMVDSSFVEFYIDNFFVFNGEFPEYAAPPTPTPADTPTPTPTQTPKTTPTPDKNNTQTPVEDKEKDFPIWIPAVIGGVIVVGLVVFTLIKKSKKK